MADKLSWLSTLHTIHNEANAFDWTSHLAVVNKRYALADRTVLGTAVEGVAPAWFNGDVEAVLPGNWTLVVSLNPAQAPGGHYRGELTTETAWDFWRHHNQRFWYTGFFRPLVRLASQSLGEQVPTPGIEEREYATSRMVFVEICPYSSPGFGLNPSQLSSLSTADHGFQVAERVRQLLLDDASPALVLVNGHAAVSGFEAVESHRISWERKEYPSHVIDRRTGRPRRLWHMQGSIESRNGKIPLAGFPFLRKPSSHNAYSEIDLLASMIRQHFVSEES